MRLRDIRDRAKGREHSMVPQVRRATSGQASARALQLMEKVLLANKYLQGLLANKYLQSFYRQSTVRSCSYLDTWHLNPG